MLCRWFLESVGINKGLGRNDSVSSHSAPNPRLGRCFSKYRIEGFLNGAFIVSSRCVLQVGSILTVRAGTST